MKARLIGVMAVVLAVGLVSGSAGAAIVTFSLEVDPSGPAYRDSKTAVLADSNVMLNLYAYFASANGTYADDGVFGGVWGALKSGKAMDANYIHGNLSWVSVNAGLQIFPYYPGDAQDLDGDTDKDIGGPNTQNDANWIILFSGAGTLLSPNDGNRLHIGTLLFTFTDNALTTKLDANTTANWLFRNKTGIGNQLNAFKVDNVGFTATAVDTRIGVGPPVNLIFVPEPMTMALLAAGGTALVAFRRRKRA